MWTPKRFGGKKKDELQEAVALEKIEGDDAADVYQKANAMIRHYFHLDPETLTLEKWAQLFQEAIWLNGHLLRQQAEMLAHLFGGKET